jgi:thiaminase/transcriptional activator TenA
MSLSTTLWNRNHDLVTACLDHPFVQGIGDGTLAERKFAYYVGQDAFFLEAFARAYSLTAAKADRWSVFQVFHTLATGVLEELRLHEGYALEWGVNLRTIQPGQATRQYTDFLLSTAWSQPVAVTAVAMAPCMRLYAFLGQSLLTQQSGSRHPYSEWIDTYGSDEFDPLAQQLEAIVDETGHENEVMQTTYRYAMEYELNFFDAAWQV